MAVSKDHCDLMQFVGSLADSRWQEKGEFIAGAAGYEAMHYLCVRNSSLRLRVKTQRVNLKSLR